jgi:hypothetical protein
MKVTYRFLLQVSEISIKNEEHRHIKHQFQYLFAICHLPAFMLQEYRYSVCGYLLIDSGV